MLFGPIAPIVTSYQYTFFFFLFLDSERSYGRIGFYRDPYDFSVGMSVLIFNCGHTSECILDIVWCPTRRSVDRSRFPFPKRKLRRACISVPSVPPISIRMRPAETLDIFRTVRMEHTRFTVIFLFDE